MKIIDFHLHIYPQPDVQKELAISKEKSLHDFLINLSRNLELAKINLGMAIILDIGFLANKNAVKTIKKLILSKKVKNLIFSVMLDFRDKKVLQDLETLTLLGFKGIKFHPIQQKILPQDYKKAKQLALAADKYKKIIIIDTHHVGLDSDIYSGLNFAKYILPDIKGPVILAHSGGLKALEAVVLALDYKNVYLETSFSVPFWQGSSIEQDLAFTFKKLGSARCLYGSDAPFIDLEESLKAIDKFFKKYNFSKKDIENIMHNTADKILSL